MHQTAARIGRALNICRNWLQAEATEALGHHPKCYGTWRQALRHWIGHVGVCAPCKGRVLITALRHPTWIEWALYAGCVLRRMGYASTFLYSSETIHQWYRQDPMTLARAIPDCEMVDLDALASSEAEAERWAAQAELAGPAALAYDHHVEEHDVRQRGSRHHPELAGYLRQLSRTAAAFDRWLSGRRFDRFLCYSGLIADTGMLLEVARSRGLTTVCLETWAWRPGHMIYNCNAPALEYNIGGWLAALGEWDDQKEREITAYLKFLDREEDAREDWLDNYYAIQKAKVGADLPQELARFLDGPSPVFLLAPNVIGDSSTLRRETIFESQQSWTREVIERFKAAPERKLIIRAHPAEEWVGAKCVVHMAEVAKAAARGASNIWVIDASEHLNTFTLLPFVRAGLVWMSSAGVDFVVRGVPTAVAARPKYESMGIVEMPGSRAEYFRLIDRWAQQPERPTDQQRRAGKRYLHLVFKGFSFEAGARNFRGTQLVMDAMPNQAEHDQFFRIIAGEQVMPETCGGGNWTGSGGGKAG